MDHTSILVSTFAPFPTLSLSLPSSTPLDSLPSIITNRLSLSNHALVLSLPQRPLELTDDPISSLCDDEQAFISLRLAPRLLGGKGGFSSQLRAQGGRMSSQKTNNNDSCRDLNGRRLSTVKEAKKMAQYLEDEPIRKKALLDARMAKLEALERKLGITNEPSSSNAEAGPSDPNKVKEPEPVAGKKHRFDDTEYLEQSETITDNIKSAVVAGLLKKRKKAKLAPAPNDPTVETPASGVPDVAAPEVVPATVPAAA